MRTRLQQPLAEVGAGLDEVFAVIQDDERVLVAQGVDQQVVEVVAGLLRDTQRAPP